MRLDKFLSHTGYGSRKDVKKLLQQKHIKVNGDICVKDKTQINEFHDIVTFDDEVITYAKHSFIMLHKPAGVVTALSDSLHETVMDCFEEFIGHDMFPVGRLDIDTEGLLLLCNDGKLSHQLLSPKHHVNKTYYVKTRDDLNDNAIMQLEKGIDLGDFISAPATAKQLSAKELQLTIQEGKFHQVKRMLEAVDNEVVYLKRIAFGPLSLDETMEPGTWRYLSEDEVTALYQNKEEIK